MLEKYSLVSYQINLFPRTPLLLNTTQLAGKLLGLSHYTGEVTILPISGTNAPEGLNAITLKTPNGFDVCEVSNDKISLTWLLDAQTRPDVSTEDMVNLVQRVCVAAISESARFKRIGVIAMISQPLEEAGPGLSGLQGILASQNQLHIPRQEGVSQFFLNITYDLSTLSAHPKCFRSFNIGTTRQALPPNGEVFAVQQDVNTQPDETNEFDLPFIQRFILESAPLLTKEATYKWIWP